MGNKVQEHAKLHDGKPKDPNIKPDNKTNQLTNPNDKNENVPKDKPEQKEFKDEIVQTEPIKIPDLNEDIDLENRDKNDTEILQVVIDPTEEKNKQKIKSKIRDPNIPFIHRFPKNDTENGYEDEIHRNQNFGTPVRIKNKVFLTYDFKVVPDPVSPKLAINFLPPGWRLPTFEDFEELVSSSKLEGFRVLTKKLKMNSSTIYITSTKSAKQKVIGNEDDSWVYKSILIGENDFKITDTNTFKYKEALYCKLVASEVLDVEFESPIVAIVNREVVFKLPEICNITTFEWDFDDGLTSKSKIAAKAFKNVREHNVKLKLILFGNRAFEVTKSVWVVNDFKHGEDEIIKEIDYGPPVLIGRQVWLKYDMLKYHNFQKKMVGLGRGWGPGQNGENSYIDSVACCPIGWRLPTKDDIEELLKCAGNNDLQRVQYLLMSEGFAAKLNANGVCHYICFDLIDDLLIQKEKYQKNDPEFVSNIGLMAGNQNVGRRNTGNNIINNNAPAEIPNMRNYKDLNVNNLDKHLNNEDFFNNIKYYDNNIISNFNYYDITRKSAYCLEINSNKAFISNRSTNMSSLTSFFSTRLIACDSFELDINMPEKDPFVNEEIAFEIKQPNLISCSWDFGEENAKIISNEKAVKHKYSKEGKYVITVKAIFFGNRGFTTTKEIFIQNFQAMPTFFKGESQIFTAKLDYVHCLRSEAIHFTYASSTLVPAKDGGMYLVYHDIVDFKLKILKINTRPEFEVKDYIFQKEYLKHLDACCTEKGVCLLVSDIRDKDLLFLMLVNEKGETLFLNTIMQNGSLPLNAFKDQLIFIDPVTNKPYHGINAMHQPKSGKLCYGKGKILVIFSYYNYFGYSRQGAREDNNGDSIIVFNEDGTEVHLASIWSTSHSLRQTACYDGRYFFTASLGDALPQNIKIVRVDPLIQSVVDNYKNRRNVNYPLDRSNTYMDLDIGNALKDSNYTKFSIIHGLHNYRRNRAKSKTNEPFSSSNVLNFDQINKNNQGEDLIHPDLKYSHYVDNKEYINEASSFLQYDTMTVNLIDGCVPGDMMGQSSGRLGSLIAMGGNNTAITYSRIPCTNSFGDSNKQCEFGILIFNSELVPMKKILLFESDDVNCIKSARYGNNIFLMFSTTDRRFGEFLSDYVGITDPCFGFLVDSEGFTVSDCVELKECKFNPNDELVTLRDGSVAWTFIDETNTVRINILYVEKKQSMNIADKKQARPGAKKRDTNNTKDKDSFVNKPKETIVFTKPQNNVIVFHKKNEKKKYPCYVDKPEKLDTNIRNDDEDSVLAEKMRQLELLRKNIGFNPKDLFKVREKKYDFIMEGRTFTVSAEKKPYFRSAERKHNFLKKDFHIKKKKNFDDVDGVDLGKPSKNARPKEGRKNYFKAKMRDHSFIKKGDSRGASGSPVNSL